MATSDVGQNNEPEAILELARQVELPHGDLLEALLVTQRKFLDGLVTKHPERWGGPAEHLKETVVMIIAEAVELLNWLPWKKHKQEFGRELTGAEHEAAIEEAVDLLHFVYNLFIILGVRDGAQVYRFYMAKHGVNKQRQRDGY